MTNKFKELVETKSFAKRILKAIEIMQLSEKEYIHQLHFWFGIPEWQLRAEYFLMSF